MDHLLGSILLFSGDYAPENFSLCNGNCLTIKDNQALFSIIGNKYGGDGKSFFNLPKLDAPSSGLSYIICTNGLYPVRS